MKVKRFKINVPEQIVGMSFNDAKKYCLNEGYQLLHKNDETSLDITYIITVDKVDNNGNIEKAKYGK